MESTSYSRKDWSVIIEHAYKGVVAITIVCWIIVGVMLKNDIILVSDCIAVLSLFNLFLMYIVADGLLNSRFFWCLLRAAFLPLAGGVIICCLLADWDNPLLISLMVSFFFILESLVLVDITRIFRRLQVNVDSGKTKDIIELIRNIEKKSNKW